MDETVQSQNGDCQSPYHDEHLCYLMYTGVHLEDKAGYKQLVQNAKYRCKKCGRTTHADRNICEPTPL